MRKDLKRNLDKKDRICRVKSISQVVAILFLVLAVLCIPISTLNNPKLETSVFYFFLSDSVFFSGFVVFAAIGVLAGVVYLVTRNKLN